jgi:cytidylate kinase
MPTMSCDVERLVNALVGSELLAQRKHAEDMAQRGSRPVVTVSRDHGAEGEAVARSVADRLGLCCYDRKILDEVARRAQVDIELVKSLDEHARLMRGEWWRSVLKGEILSRDDYRGHLVKVVLGIAGTGGVIVGRGANLILSKGEAFRVRVVGSLERCAQRAAQQEGLDVDSARRRVRDVNGERSRYLRRLYAADIHDSKTYDLVVNSDRLPVEGMVDVIVTGMRAAGKINPLTGQT